MVLWWCFKPWNSCRIAGTGDHGAMVTSCCCFCRIPFADIITGLKLILLPWCNCDTSLLHIMSHFCSVWRMVVPTVCMSVAHIAITFPFVLLTTGVFGVLQWFSVNIVFAFNMDKHNVIVCQFHRPPVKLKYIIPWDKKALMVYHCSVVYFCLS